MKNLNLKLFGIIAFTALIAFSMAACGGSSSSSDPDTSLTGSVALFNTSPEMGDIIKAVYVPGGARQGSGTPTWTWFSGAEALKDANGELINSDVLLLNTAMFDPTQVAADFLDENAVITARVSFTNRTSHLTSGSAIIIETGEKAPISDFIDVNELDKFIGGVAITGSPLVGQTLQVYVDGKAIDQYIEDEGGLDEGEAVYYVWVRGDVSSGDFEVIPGNNKAEYTLTIADLGEKISVILAYTATSGYVYTNATDEVNAEITAAQLTGVTSPVTGQTPSTNINNSDSFTATLAWNGNPAEFAPGVVYTATITLTAEDNYFFPTDVFEDTASIAGFTVNSNVPTSYTSNSGSVLVFTVAFPETTVLDIVAQELHGFSSPVATVAPVTTVTAGTGFTGTITWDPDDDPFEYSTEYTATITLTAATGYVFPASFNSTASIAGFIFESHPPTEWISRTNNELVFTFVFEETDDTPPTNIAAAALTGVTNPEAGESPSSITINNGTGFTAHISGWDPDDDPFDYGTVYTVTIELERNGNYVFPDTMINTAGIAGFTVNGIAPAWVSRTATQLVFTITFPATELDLSALTALIGTANTAKEGVVEAANADAVAPTVTWVPVGALTTFNAAITTAEGVTGPDQATVDAAVDTLQGAIDTFNGQKNQGTTLSLSELSALIGTANTAKEGVVEAANADAVAPSVTWVPVGALTTLNAAISTAEGVTGPTQADIISAVSTLQGALNTFNGQKNQGANFDDDLDELLSLIEHVKGFEDDLNDTLFIRPNGEDVSVNHFWLTQEEYNAIEAAVIAAELVTGPTRSAVRQAISDLQDVLDNNELKPGEKVD